MQFFDNLFARQARLAKQTQPAPKEQMPMSWLSNFVGGLEKAIEGNPQSAAALTNLKNDGQTLADNLAVAGVNAVLGMIPGGALFDGLADDVIPLVVGKLWDAASSDAQTAILNTVSAKKSAS